MTQSRHRQDEDGFQEGHEGSQFRYATEGRVYEILAAALGPVENRLRRIEIGFAGLIVAVASPKVGGPSAHHVAMALINLL